MSHLVVASEIWMSGICTRYSLESEGLLFDYLDFADPRVVAARRSIKLGNMSLDQYVPLCWAPFTPTQYVWTVKQRTIMNDDLVFFEFWAPDVLRLDGVWTTDGHLASQKSSFYPGRGAVPYLDWDALLCRNCRSAEHRRKKHAEVLVPGALSRSLISRVVVYSQDARNRLFDDLCANEANPNYPPAIEVDTSLYF